MIAEPLVLTIGAVETDFFRTLQGTNNSLYVADGSTESEARRVRIQHSSTRPDKKDPNFRIDRHLVTLIHEKWNDTAQRKEAMTINLTINIPANDTFSRTNLDNFLVGLEGEILADAFLDKLLRGES